MEDIDGSPSGEESTTSGFPEEYHDLLVGLQNIVGLQGDEAKISPDILSKVLNVMLEFVNSISSATSNDGCFLSLSNLEEAHSVLKDKMVNICRELDEEQVSKINQLILCQKKKMSTSGKE
jgi:hypothetical protein